jgi:hypothetical protein
MGPRGPPALLIGDSGTGKSHLLIALGPVPTETGYRIRYTLASKLLNELVRDPGQADHIIDSGLVLCRRGAMGLGHATSESHGTRMLCWLG